VTPPLGEATRLLQAVREGDAGAGERLVELLYGELHALGERHGRRDQTLAPTALVHEVWLKLEGHLAHFADRRHFLAAASQAMRQVLANHARAERALRRGGGRVVVTLDGNRDGRGGSDLAANSTNAELDLVALDDSLRRLAELDARQARVVELRFLCSLTIPETADVLGVSEGTVKSDWVMAQAWLRRELRMP